MEVTTRSEHQGPSAKGRASFEKFYADEHRTLFAVMSMVAGRGDAEDLMQEAFLRVWRKWDRVASMENPRGYLYRTAINLNRMRIRAAAAHARRVFRFGDDGASEAATMEDRVSDKDAVQRALMQLSPRRRAAFVLVGGLGMSSREAAQVLGVRDSTVRELSSKARRDLANLQLEEES